MKCIEKGHVYELDVRGEGPKKSQMLMFVNKEPGKEHQGVTTQEVLRALIDRTRHCNNCMPHPNNERAIYHLRMALIMHEARALERRTEKGEIEPEFILTGSNGHFMLGGPGSASTGVLTPELTPYRQDWDRQCNHNQE